MRRHADYVDLAFGMFAESARRGVLFHTAEDEVLDGRCITVTGQKWLNFASCSYLGLELDERLKAGAIEAVSRYGTQFSASRAAVSAPPYKELEALLEAVFDAIPLPTPTTSLGHIAALPALVEDTDLMVLDQQVHASVMNAANLARVHGAGLEVIRHNNLAQLEDILVRERGRRRHIWYLADGVYSMYGDFAPIEALMKLLGQHEQLHLYVDDAHAMSWCGQHGRGFVLGNTPLHPRMVVATSLNKAFACAGGVLLLPDPKLRARVRMGGGPLIFSGPLQPPMLGAAVAAARLHLSPEFPALQHELLERIRHCNRVCNALGLPLVSQDESPVRFIATGLPQVSYDMVERLQREGFYLTVAVFPLVPMKRAGLRLTLTRHLSLDDISRLAEAVAHHLPLALQQAGSSLEEVRAAFQLGEAEHPQAVARPTPTHLRLEKVTSIARLDAEEWDALLGNRGTFGAEALALLEATFEGQAHPENNWRFLYYLVRDGAGKAVAATFFTETLWKDDMIASPDVSRLAEQRRRKDPTFLTSRTLAMGSLLTEGDHLYLDRTGDWREALRLILRDVAEEQSHGARVLVLRDLDAEDPELDAYLLSQGFARYLMPETMVLDLAPDYRLDDYMARLTRRSRRFLKQEVLPRTSQLKVRLAGGEAPALSQDELRYLHRLYANVQARSFELNTFTLPLALFERMNGRQAWEFLLLHVPPEAGGACRRAARGFLGRAPGAGPLRPAPGGAGLPLRRVSRGLPAGDLGRHRTGSRGGGHARVLRDGGGPRKASFRGNGKPPRHLLPGRRHLQLRGPAPTDGRGGPEPRPARPALSAHRGIRVASWPSTREAPAASAASPASIAATGRGAACGARLAGPAVASGGGAARAGSSPAWGGSPGSGGGAAGSPPGCAGVAGAASTAWWRSRVRPAMRAQVFPPGASRVSTAST
ncbi:MAG: aminotransferase class I/II-fold pyridoxal phosphate-dependent enzyme [Candidatus Sericytochromatia bacterium]|nr:aminotransferase class I/II-fold pyridoxal phosphate-dependent enzyme [Candidatus Sericytochromatia bacterium]